MRRKTLGLRSVFLSAALAPAACDPAASTAPPGQGADGRPPAAFVSEEVVDAEGPAAVHRSDTDDPAEVRGQPGARASPPADGGRATAAHYWPSWRGPLGTGIAPHANPPVEWSEDKNIRWKVSLPGKGHSTPVIWGDRVFLTAAIPYGDPAPPPVGRRPGSHDNAPSVTRQRFVVLAVSRRDGKILWQQTMRDGVPHEGGHYTGSFASASPVTDGERVLAFFGSHGLYALDLEGGLQWGKRPRRHADPARPRRRQLTRAP